MLSKNIDDIPNGSIVLVGPYAEPILIITSRGLGKWGINLNYGPTWYNPHEVVKDICAEQIISDRWIEKAKLTLDRNLMGSWFSNLDYIEALAKLKEYEMP